MPELPEVESIRRSLEPFILNERVISAKLIRRDILVAPGDPPGGFSRQSASRSHKPKRLRPTDLLQDSTITSVSRVGKQLIIANDKDAALIVQLGMTGTLTFVPGDQPKKLSPHVHVLWRLAHGTLLFDDARRFGSVRLFRTLAELGVHLTQLGPDALTISPDDLAAGLAGGKRAVKAALLDQSVLAGVGNIYADEALHTAGIAPTRLARSLKPAEVAKLAKAIRATLEAAIAANGSTLRNYANARGEPGDFQSKHAVYGRAGQPCLTCGKPLTSRLIAQRTTVWCRDCQH